MDVGLYGSRPFWGGTWEGQVGSVGTDACAVLVRCGVPFGAEKTVSRERNGLIDRRNND